MNRINSLFQNKKRDILSIYFTAGHPALNTASTIIKELENSGVDMIEIGFPFSDPLADGPVIQDSSQKALNNGMSLKVLIKELADIRKSVNIPLLLMGYFNTVLKFGVENFCKELNSIGIDGVILPDMPLDVYKKEYVETFDKYNIIPVFLICPGTSEQRIREIDNLSKGFIYVVSTASTTGAKVGFDDDALKYFQRVKEMNLSTPTITGFGISNKHTFNQACEFSNGGIIGSAFVKQLDEKGIDAIDNIITTLMKKL